MSALLQIILQMPMALPQLSDELHHLRLKPKEFTQHTIKGSIFYTPPPFLNEKNLNYKFEPCPAALLLSRNKQYFYVGKVITVHNSRFRSWRGGGGMADISK